MRGELQRKSLINPILLLIMSGDFNACSPRFIVQPIARLATPFRGAGVPKVVQEPSTSSTSVRTVTFADHRRQQRGATAKGGPSAKRQVNDWDLSTHQRQLSPVPEGEEESSEFELELHAQGTIDSDSEGESATGGTASGDEETARLENQIKQQKRLIAAAEKKARLQKELDMVNQRLQAIQKPRVNHTGHIGQSNHGRAGREPGSDEHDYVRQALHMDEGRRGDSRPFASMDHNKPFSQGKSDTEEFGFISNFMSKFDPDNIESVTSSSSDSDGRHTKKSKGKKSKKNKSGMYAKATDHVARRQIWPHLALGDEYPGKRLTFKSLDFPLYVAGELEIITCTSQKISDTERRGRLHLLKAISYLHKHADWDMVRDIYASILNRVEQGLLSWEQPGEFHQQINWLVTKKSMERYQSKTKGAGSQAKSSGTGQKKKDEGIWYCRAFNVGSCEESGDHSGKLMGRFVTLRHICGKCWIADKVQRRHSETSPECPARFRSVEQD